MMMMIGKAILMQDYPFQYSYGIQFEDFVLENCLPTQHEKYMSISD